MNQLRTFISSIFYALAVGLNAQVHSLGENLMYKVEVSSAGATGEYAPLWMSANRYGLSSVSPCSGYLRAGIERPIESDLGGPWRFGYGADVAFAAGYTSCVIPQQVFAEVEYRNVRLELGQKEREMPMLNDELSTGGMTFSNNYRPVPQARIGIPHWCNISGRSHFLAIKGHVAYGMLTDGRWQRKFATMNGHHNLYAQNVLYHSKALYFRLGRPEGLPLSGVFGLEMIGEFGGKAYNLNDRGGTDNDNFQSNQVLSHTFKDFWHAFIPGGSDVNDGDYANVAGNQLGSWVFSLDWSQADWGVRAYYDHFFEDHSQMFFQYGWRDHLLGLEATLPSNRFVSTILYEHLNTTDQSGAVYHDITAEMPYPVYGLDQYYSHHVYGAFQHWGQVMGNPLILSPIYNDRNAIHNQQYRIYAYHNRVRAHHIGLSGHPTSEVSWRMLFTHQHSLGAYSTNIEDVKATHLLLEAAYEPNALRDWRFAVGFSHTGGSLMGNTQGLQVTIRKTGLLTRRQHD